MNNILQAALTAFIVLVIIFGIPVLKQWWKTTEDTKLKEFIYDAVWAAQQTIVGNPEKKQFVLDMVNNWLAQNKIFIDPAIVDALIESAVLSMKTETSGRN